MNRFFFTLRLFVISVLYFISYCLQAQANFINNGYFDEVTDVYYTKVNSGLDNVIEWKGINTVDFFKEKQGKRNCAGLTTVAPLEFMHTSLNGVLMPKKKYRMNISVLSSSPNIPLSILLIHSNDSVMLNEFNIPVIAQQDNCTLIPIADSYSQDNGRKEKWRVYTFEFTVRSEADLIIIGNCTNKTSAIGYYALDDLIIEEVTTTKGALSFPQKK